MDRSRREVQVALVFKRLVFLGWNIDVQYQYPVEPTLWHGPVQTAYAVWRNGLCFGLAGAGAFRDEKKVTRR